MNKNLFLICLISFFATIFLIIGKIAGWHFEVTYYLGLCFIGLNFISFFFAKKYFNYTLGLTLLIGLSGLIHFFPFKIGFTFFGIAIQVIPLLFIIIFSYINKSRILDFLISSSIKNENEKLDTSNRKKEIFRKEFENLSETELTNKLNLDLTTEAREIVIEILKHKKATQ